MSTGVRARPRLAPLSSVEDLAASIAHEMNQPLAAIVVNAQSCLSWLAKKRPDLDMARKAAQRIIHNGRHASEVIRSVRAMLGNAHRAMSRVNVNTTVCEALESMALELASRSVTLETRLCRDARCVRGDRTQILQVLLNLFRNAVEAMSSTNRFPRTLRVVTSTDVAGNVSVAISDTGPGLDAATAKRIFEPFFTTKSDGMGLGLSISRSIVQAHGGSLSVRPRAPHGCTFELTLPAHGRL